MDNTLETKHSALPLLHQISGLSIGDTLALLTESFPGGVAFSTSFGMEDQVISHHILSPGLPVSIFYAGHGPSLLRDVRCLERHQ